MPRYSHRSLKAFTMSAAEGSPWRRTKEGMRDAFSAAAFSAASCSACLLFESDLPPPSPLGVVEEPFFSAAITLEAVFFLFGEAEAGAEGEEEGAAAAAAAAAAAVAFGEEEQVAAAFPEAALLRESESVGEEADACSASVHEAALGPLLSASRSTAASATAEIAGRRAPRSRRESPGKKSEGEEGGGEEETGGDAASVVVAPTSAASASSLSSRSRRTARGACLTPSAATSSASARAPAVGEKLEDEAGEEAASPPLPAPPPLPRPPSPPLPPPFPPPPANSNGPAAPSGLLL